MNSKFSTILAIESSCDETAAAIIRDGRKILHSSVASSTLLHAKYGGIVPEIAAREQLMYIIPVITEVLRNLDPDANQNYKTIIANTIDAIAVTQGPGLIGSLLVGIETAKTLSFITKKPLIPVNHVIAHMFANFINQDPIQYPAVSLVVSGGHTELYLMKSAEDIHWIGGTLDDAAGEAFDKTARLLGFENRGGVAIQESASKATSHQMVKIAKLPRPMLDNNNIFNFSFSGLKTAILREVNTLKNANQFNEHTINQLAYEVQESITDVLIRKTLHAAETHNAQSILLSGGVSANLRLREKLISKNSGYTIHIPPVNLCTDNAAYIGSYAYFRGTPTDWGDVTAIPDLSVEV